MFLKGDQPVKQMGKGAFVLKIHFHLPTPVKTQPCESSDHNMLAKCTSNPVTKGFNEVLLKSGHKLLKICGGKIYKINQYKFYQRAIT